MDLNILNDEIMLVVLSEESENEDGSSETVNSKPEKVLDEETGTLYEVPIIKEEVLDEDETVEYWNESGELYTDFIKVENEDDDEDYVPEEEAPDEDIPEEDSGRKWKHRHLKPWQWKSFVKLYASLRYATTALKKAAATPRKRELREQYEELKEDEGLLVNSLAEIMKSVKPPAPPRDHYILNDIMFECVVCSALTDTIPAAGRHYQEKHGPRYLICFACGVDFRSTTNLYKHEKRCPAPDAVLVLRARALSVGNKGRARPFLQPRGLRPLGYRVVEGGKVKIKQRYTCDQCPGAFNNKEALVSHLRLHSGQRPYKCSACPYAYTSQSALSRHMKKHSDVKYICDHCSRSFQVKTALITHLDTHLPYKKHKCEECGYRYAQKSALLLHINSVHRKLPPPCACQLCPKRYRRMTLLKAHMKKEHGMLLMTRKMFFKKLPTMSDTQIEQAKIVLKTDLPLYYVDKPERDHNEEFLSYIEKNYALSSGDS